MKGIINYWVNSFANIPKMAPRIWAPSIGQIPFFTFCVDNISMSHSMTARIKTLLIMLMDRLLYLIVC